MYLSHKVAVECPVVAIPVDGSLRFKSIFLEKTRAGICSVFRKKQEQTFALASKQCQS
jgi:hypothetical protein